MKRTWLRALASLVVGLIYGALMFGMGGSELEQAITAGVFTALGWVSLAPERFRRGGCGE